MSKYLDIIGILSENFDKSMNGREIARVVNLSPQTTLNKLKLMLQEKIIKKRVSGKNIEYTLSKTLEGMTAICCYEIIKSMIFLKKKELKLIIGDIIKFSESIILFVSFAKGLEKKDSDIDLIIINGNKKKINEIRKKYSRKISIEYHDYGSFYNSRNKSLFREIVKEHVIFGNSFRIVEILFGELR